GPPLEADERLEEFLLLAHRRTGAALLARRGRPQRRIARGVALFGRLLDHLLLLSGTPREGDQEQYHQRFRLHPDPPSVVRESTGPLASRAGLRSPGARVDSVLAITPPAACAAPPCPPVDEGERLRGVSSGHASLPSVRRCLVRARARRGAALLPRV